MGDTEMFKLHPAFLFLLTKEAVRERIQKVAKIQWR